MPHLDSVLTPRTPGQPIINININTGGPYPVVPEQAEAYASPGPKPSLSSEDLSSYATQVERLESQNRSRSGVDEYTEAQIKLRLEQLKKLLQQYQAAQSAGQYSSDRTADLIREQAGRALKSKEDEVSATLGVSDANRYALQSSATSSGILGTNSEPNDGSGTGMLAHHELVRRMLSKSMTNNPAEAEVKKLRSEDPMQHYPGIDTVTRRPIQ